MNFPKSVHPQYVNLSFYDKKSSKINKKNKVEVNDNIIITKVTNKFSKNISIV